jgi:hypothetical protein
MAVVVKPTGKTSTADRAGRPRAKTGRHSRPDSARGVRVLGARDLLQVSGRVDARIAAIAARQRGRVARRQLLTAGISRSAIEVRLASGRLIRRRTGVYAVGHAGPNRLTRETEALLACREQALLSHQTAAALWGIRPAQLAADPIHVLVLGTEGTRKPGIRCHRTGRLQPQDVRFHEGLAVTSPARTLLDIAPTLTMQQLEWALDEVLNRLARPAQIARLLNRSHGRPGAAILQRLLGYRRGQGRTRSHYEQRFLSLIRRANLPVPDTNVRLYGFEVDAYWPAHGVVFEIDSHRYHSSRSAFTNDRRKEAAFKSHGLDFNRVSDYQLEHEPLAVTAYVAQRLAIAVRSPAVLAAPAPARQRPLRLPGRAGAPGQEEHDQESHYGQQQAEGQADPLSVALALRQPGRSRGRQQPGEQQIQTRGSE